MLFNRSVKVCGPVNKIKGMSRIGMSARILFLINKRKTADTKKASQDWRMRVKIIASAISPRATGNQTFEDRESKRMRARVKEPINRSVMA